MEKDIIKMKYESHIEQDFFTKRMNWPETDKEVHVTDWENILATNKEIPDLTGKDGIIGIDYASISDFASAGVLIKEKGTWYWISHSWVCTQSKDINRLKIPWRDWTNEGHLTIVDDVEISPQLIIDWIEMQGRKYNLQKIAMDNFRYSLFINGLSELGFSWKEHKNIKLIRPTDIMKVSPVIESCFANQSIVWGDNPLMRWYTNNTKMIRTGVNKEMGNMTYGKIEPKSRKTDGFMAFVAAMCVSHELQETEEPVS